MRKESDSTIFNCVICKENKDFYSLGQCEHKGVCNYCSMKSRMLYNDVRCPICTTKLEYIFIVEVGDPTTFVEYSSQKDYYYIDDDYKVNYFFFIFKAKRNILYHCLCTGTSYEIKEFSMSY